MSQNLSETNNHIRQKILDTFFNSVLPSDSQIDALQEITRLIFQAVLLRIVPMLEEDDKKIYQNLVEKDSGVDELTDFFIRTVPVFEIVVNQEILNIAELLQKEYPQISSEIQAENRIAELKSVLLSKFN